MDVDKEQLVGGRPFLANLSEGIGKRLRIRTNIQRIEVKKNRKI